MKISIAYAEQSKQYWKELEVEDGITVEEALRKSDLLERFPDIDLESQKIGIFGKSAKLNGVLKDGDRVEVYRPITADPETIDRRDQ